LEPSVGIGAVPTVREAVEAALEALPADVREGARNEVEGALGRAGA
jgi:hypothetical protein